MKSMRRQKSGGAKEAESYLPRILGPAIRLLKMSGASDAGILEAAAKACRHHARERVRGVSVDYERFCRLADVVMVWARDPEFIDDAGVPKKLHLDGREPSFRRLMDKAGVSMSVASAARLLRELHSVQPCGGNRIRLVSHVLLSVAPDHFVVAPVLDEVRRFLETIEHNVCEGGDASNGRMQRTVICGSLDPARLPEAQRFVRQNAQSFLDALDEKLSTCRSRGRATPLTYGAGIYVFVDRAAPKGRPEKRRGATASRR